MAVSGELLQGKVIDNPETENKNVEALMKALLAALIKEVEES